jgi:predicted dehydrogenase
VNKRYRAILVGTGKVGVGNPADTARAQHFSFGSHAEVLSVHPRLEWVGAVDLSQDALDEAANSWTGPVFHRGLRDAVAKFLPDIAVLAIPASGRLQALYDLHGVQGLMVEKPLGVTLNDATRFVHECRRRNLIVQVNLIRRADGLMRRLAAGEMRERIGDPQTAFAVYGNGLLNNGTHLIDLVRMMFGEIDSIEAVSRVMGQRTGPMEQDLQARFILRMEQGIEVTVQPIDFGHYREMSIDIWGSKGRLSITQEGFTVQVCSRRDCRLMTGEREVASDHPEALRPEIGRSFYRMYDNLIDVLEGRDSLWSSCDSALKTAQTVSAIYDAAAPSRNAAYGLEMAGQ